MLLNTAIGKEDLVSNDTIDLNSHVDIFHAIYSQVTAFNLLLFVTLY